jgi:heme/copper-type cytochrome/quinol oxidase subunit 2
VWFFLTEGLIVYFIIRYRRKMDRRAPYVSGDSLNQLSWAFVPVAILSYRHNCSLQPILAHRTTMEHFNKNILAFLIDALLG